MSKSKKVVAIGEIGIDNYRNHSPQDIQKKVMIEQMELAYNLNLPIVFHNRDADNEIFDGNLNCIPLRNVEIYSRKQLTLYNCTSK